jgi:hypothetical protein
MADLDQRNVSAPIIDLINDPIIPHSKPVITVLSLEEFDAGRPRIIPEGLYLGEDPCKMRVLNFPQFFFRGLLHEKVIRGHLFSNL